MCYFIFKQMTCFYCQFLSFTLFCSSTLKLTLWMYGESLKLFIFLWIAHNLGKPITSFYSRYFELDNIQSAASLCISRYSVSIPSHMEKKNLKLYICQIICLIFIFNRLCVIHFQNILCWWVVTFYKSKYHHCLASYSQQQQHVVYQS